MNADLKNFQQQEEESLKQIQEHVKKSIKAKVKYGRTFKNEQIQKIRQGLELGDEIENFWEECKKNFDEQMKALFVEPEEILKYRVCGDYEISWSDSIDHLRWAYEDVKEEYGIEDEEA